MPLDCQITHIAVHTSTLHAPVELYIRTMLLQSCANSSCARPAGQVLPVDVVDVVAGCKNYIKNILLNSHA